MADAINLLGIPGSIRDRSTSRAALRAAALLLPAHASLQLADIEGIPGFDESRPTDPAPRLLELKQQIRAADALLFAAPEYLYGLLTVLDNVIESAAQPPSDNAWAGKPVALIGTSRSDDGLALAQHNLRQRLLAQGMRPVTQEPLLIGCAQRAFGGHGQLRDAGLRASLRALLADLVHAARMSDRSPGTQTGAGMAAGAAAHRSGVSSGLW